MKKYVEIFEKFEKAFDAMPIKKKKIPIGKICMLI